MSWRWRAVTLIPVALIGCRSLDQPSIRPGSRIEAHAEAAGLLRSYSGRAEPLVVFIDGQRVVEPEPSGRFSVINPDRIGSIQLLTGAAAEAKAGRAGRRGVIWIITK